MHDAEIARTIASLLDARAADATICPSEVARAIAPGDESAWRALMPRIRTVASNLAARGEVRVTRRGVVVGALDAGGPIRIGRP